MPFSPENFTVWTEIPVTDMDRGVAFYNAVTDAGLVIETTGPNPMAVFKTTTPGAGVSCHLYPGKPAADGQGPTIHLAAPGTCEEIMERVSSAGGTVVSPAIEIPAGRFFYAQDPDGNSVGFFEAR